MSLKTDYKDYIPATTLRKYQQIDNGDGTVSFQDVTVYTQTGDKAPAATFNDIGTAVNAAKTAADSAVQSVSVNGVMGNKVGTGVNLPAYPVVPASLKNPNALNVSVGVGGSALSYDGSSAQSISIPKLSLSTAAPVYTVVPGEIFGSST